MPDGRAHPLFTQMIGVHENLPVQVREENFAFMGEYESADARGSQINGRRTPESADTGDHDRRFFQRLLTVFTQQLKLPCITFHLHCLHKSLLHVFTPPLLLMASLFPSSIESEAFHDSEVYPSRLRRLCTSARSLYLSRKVSPSSTHATP
ncbi:hypothetical protein D3C73_1192180 [compost metagenome]